MRGGWRLVTGAAVAALMMAALTMIPGAAPAAADGAARLAPVAATERAADMTGLPLGPPDLPEYRDTSVLAAGVTLTTITRGYSSNVNFWTVTVAFVPARTTADQLADRLRVAGFAPRVEQVDGRSSDDPVRGPVGFLVRAGRSDSKQEMTDLAAQLTAAGFVGGDITNTVVNTALDGSPTTGPWVVRVLRVDRRRSTASVRAHLGTDIVPDREKVSSTSARLGAIAAVNGGYFVIGAADGTPGDLAGISMLDGHLVSEAVNGRAALLLPVSPAGGAQVRRLSDRLTLRASDGARRDLNGIDRVPGLIRSCGEPGDQPTSAPRHDFTCTNGNEIIGYDSVYGSGTDTGAGVRVVLDARNRVVQVTGSRGGPIPTAGEVLEGIGDGAAWLSAHARVGDVIAVHETVVDEDGHAVPWSEHADAVNGGPLLVRDGWPFVDAYTEGFVQPDRPSFYYGFAISRNPRTMAGVTRDGDLLLVTVDGRAPGYSVGESFTEEAATMRALGAIEALNLDGGGSTTMVADQQLLGHPSDATGERPVGDAILVLPRPGR